MSQLISVDTEAHANQPDVAASVQGEATGVAAVEEEEEEDELSNDFLLYPPICFRGKRYSSVTHLCESLRYDYGDASYATQAYSARIRTASTAREARALGSLQESDAHSRRTNALIGAAKRTGVQPYADWEDTRYTFLRVALVLKFQHHDSSCEALLSATPQQLFEMALHLVPDAEATTFSGISQRECLLLMLTNFRQDTLDKKAATGEGTPPMAQRLLLGRRRIEHRAPASKRVRK